MEQQRVRSIEANRLLALGEMAAGVAHELNQPLNGIRAFAEGTVYGIRAGWQTTAAQVSEAFDDIVVQVDRMTDILDHMRLFARDTSQADPVPFAVAEAVRGTMKLVGAQLRAHGIDVRITEADDPPLVTGYPTQIEQVLLNLLANARDALDDRQSAAAGPSPWRPQLTLSVTRDDGDGQVRITVTDNGGGVRPDVVGRIFDPFFTTKEVGKGTGLGLSIARGIIEKHGGTLELESRPGDGVTVTITLPATAAQTAAEQIPGVAP